MTYELDVPNEVYHQEWPGYSSTFIKTAYEKQQLHGLQICKVLGQ